MSKLGYGTPVSAEEFRRLSENKILLRINAASENDSERELEADVQEEVGYDPSCYQYDTGWLVYVEETDEEFFVSRDGSIYEWESNDPCGIAPEVKRWADEFDAYMNRLESD